MPRTSRASAAGYCYHALHRSNARAYVSREDHDYEAFLAMMAASRASIRRDWPLGTESWVRTTAGILGLESSLRRPERRRPRVQQDRTPPSRPTR